MNWIKKYLDIIIISIVILFVIIAFWIFRHSFIDSIKEFSIFYSFIATVILVFITTKYVLLTRDLVKETREASLESLLIKKEEKTLFYLEKLDFENLSTIRNKINDHRYFNRELFNNIILLDAISSLYKANKLVKDLIYPRLAIYCYKFFLDFHKQIYNLLTTSGLYGNEFNYYENFLDLLDIIMDEKILKVKKYETDKTYLLIKETIEKIRDKIRR